MRKLYCKSAYEFSIGKMSISITHDTEEKDLLFKGLKAAAEKENLVYIYRRFHCLMSQKVLSSLEFKKAFWGEIGQRLNEADTTPQVRQMVHKTADSNNQDEFTNQVLQYLDEYVLKFPDRNEENFYYRFFMILLDDSGTFLKLDDYHSYNPNTIQKIIKTFMYSVLDEHEYWMALYAMKGIEIPDYDRKRFKFPDLEPSEIESINEVKEKLQAKREKICAILAR